MTKTINIPISKETCHTIKHGIGWFLWIGATAGLIFTFVYSLNIVLDKVPTGDNSLPVAAGLVFSPFLAVISIWVMFAYLKETDHWIEFKCNCDDKKVES